MFLAEAIERIILCLTTSGQRCDVAKCSPEQLTQLKGDCARGQDSEGTCLSLPQKMHLGFP